MSRQRAASLAAAQAKHVQQRLHAEHARLDPRGDVDKVAPALQVGVVVLRRVAGDHGCADDPPHARARRKKRVEEVAAAAEVARVALRGIYARWG